ncbi:cellulase family glycosylhydrolase [Kiritimatiella glycovorans]|uniref:Endoglycoceramidase (Glycosyl hydrolase family 5) n=1 Tax=Kiritimatiella glycovorans TaxID=1307763 RepID=A0A0G3EGV6_9BACT|nr:cellulase family glycosylhydrolase [Kiritimatiella glycovorans]AKJ63359.1 Endoglycoceramidase (glycosyl hydrolase family 5) [Kiritimatiella glycovorans]
MNVTLRFFAAMFAVIFLFCGLAASGGSETAGELPGRPWFLDEHNRHFIMNGVVMNTEDSRGDLHFPREAYERMRPMGLNVQVVRLLCPRLGGWPGTEWDPEYLEKVDRLVRLGREAGMKTIFKMTLYDLTDVAYGKLTEEHWAQLFLDRDDTQEAYLGAWMRVFERYADNCAVYGYDLLNEPLAAGGGSRRKVWEVAPELGGPERFEREYFMPLYRRVIDRLREISPDKWAFFQPMHVTIPEHIESGFPCHRVTISPRRDQTAYAPHYYGTEPEKAVNRYLEDAAVAGTPLFIGEYGPATKERTDTNLQAQIDYKLNLMRTVELLDRNVIGHVKAWWCGSRVYNASAHQRHRRTWAIFKGDSQALGPEREYILDVMARPRPLFVAGKVGAFHFDFATRVFEMEFSPGAARGPSEIFIPADRHYPDGFRIRYRDLELAWNPKKPRGFSVVSNPERYNRWLFRWNRKQQRLIVKRWPDHEPVATLRVVPGWRD